MKITYRLTQTPINPIAKGYPKLQPNSGLWSKFPRHAADPHVLRGPRAEEAVAVALRDCRLPRSGWGRLIVHYALSQAGKRWTDTGRYHDEPVLKNRSPAET